MENVIGVVNENELSLVDKLSSFKDKLEILVIKSDAVVSDVEEKPKTLLMLLAMSDKVLIFCSDRSKRLL